jgi:hypothetical protein
VTLRADVPVVASPFGYDDGLFVRLATYVSHGTWLGPYDELTLVKVPGYPLFMSWVHERGIPLKIAEQMIQVVAAATVAGAVWLFGRRWWPVVPGFAVLALNPAAFTVTAAQIRREFWYGSVSLLALVLVFLMVALAVRTGWRSWSVAGLLAGPTGFVLAVYYLGREEWIWLVPALVAAVVLPIVGRAARWRWAGPAMVLRVGLVLAIAAGTSSAVVGEVVDHNHRMYGVELPDDNVSGEFSRAYQLWAGVRAGPDKPMVAITASQRAAVYEVSPLAAQLRPFLENPRNSWLIISGRSCAGHGICDDYAGWLEAFAIRAAAAQAGHFETGAHAQRYFTGLGDQIEEACRGGRLHCADRTGPLAEALRVDRVTVIRTALAGLMYVIRSPNLTLPVPPVSSLRPSHLSTPDSQRAAAAIVVGEPDSVEQARARIDRFGSDQVVHRALAEVYQVLLPLLGVLGVVGVLGAVFLRSRARPGLLGLAVVLGIAVISRLVLLSVFDVTVLPDAVFQPTYQMPTQLMLLGFGTVGTAQLLLLLRWRRTTPIAGTDPVREPAGSRTGEVDLRDGGSGSVGDGNLPTGDRDRGRADRWETASARDHQVDL